MREHEEIKALFQKYLANQCTKEEFEKLFRHWGTSESETAVREMIRQQLETDAGEQLANTGAEEEWLERNFAQVHNRLQPDAAWPEKNRRIRPLYWQVAAAVAGVLLLAGWLFEQHQSDAPMITQKTTFGEQRIVVLPDHSTVTLNGNSSLTYPQHWEQAREVWLQGEAYFSVTHTSGDRRFVVHTTDRLNVEVLGTEFNVSDRKSGTQVVLNKGSIRLRMQEEASTAPTVARTLLMKPGERVAWDENTGKYTKALVEPSRYFSWKEQKMSFDHTSLKEIAQNLQETFGLTVQASEPGLWNQQVSGSMSSENEQRIIQQLEILFSVKITREGRVITLHPIP